jgi:hypothetical protein
VENGRREKGRKENTFNTVGVKTVQSSHSRRDKREKGKTLTLPYSVYVCFR